jgi:hypothetical protein
MKATVSCLGAVLLAGLSAPLALAQPYYQHIGPPRPPAPDACGPGFVAPNECGCPFGPNYCLRPPWEPFNGLRPNFEHAPGQPGVPAKGYPHQPAYPGMAPGHPAQQAPAYPGMVQQAPGILVPHGAHPGAAAGAAATPLIAGLPPAASLPHLPGHGPAAAAPPPGCPPSFPTHPFARSPRDFFMWSEVYEDELMRQRLPAVLPGVATRVETFEAWRAR